MTFHPHAFYVEPTSFSTGCSFVEASDSWLDQSTNSFDCCSIVKLLKIHGLVLELLIDGLSMSLRPIFKRKKSDEIDGM